MRAVRQSEALRSQREAPRRTPHRSDGMSELSPRQRFIVSRADALVAFRTALKAPITEQLLDECLAEASAAYDALAPEIEIEIE